MVDFAVLTVGLNDLKGLKDLSLKVFPNLNDCRVCVAKL